MYTRKEKDNSGNRTTPLSSIGEFGLIDRLTKNFPLFHTQTIRGIGDDAAVVAAGDRVILVSTDLLIEGIHFDLTYMPLKHLGYKTAVVNISDIAAMNGIPRQLLVSIAVSSRFPAEALDELYAGIRMACDRYRVDLVGGDTSSSTKGLMISATVLGDAAPGEVVYRSGASPGDLVCVTGDLGSAYIGLLILEREKRVFQVNPAMQPELDGHEYQVGRQLKPEARCDIRQKLIDAGIHATSMIDISDGLASELLHLCKQSGTGCRLFEEKIPIDPQTKELAMEFKIIPGIAALSGGEDYELLFTVRQEDYERLSSLDDVTVVGHMTRPTEGKYMITPDGKQVELSAQGWDGFAEKA